ncbi:MAG: ferritin [Candidatus Eisenbacteria bacterium]
MLSAKIEKALNDQIRDEDYAAHYYLALASWCANGGLPGSASFLFAHAEEEREHMMRLLHYVNDAGGHGRVAAVAEPPAKFESLQDVFERTLEHERKVTAQINRVVDLCLGEKDYSTFHFLQWYVAEQHEEEKLFQSILDMMRVAGLEGRGLFLVDKEIGKMARRATAPRSGGGAAS